MPITAGSLLREKRTMAKNKEEKTNVMRVLEQKKIAYTAHSYPHEEGVAVVSEKSGIGTCVSEQSSSSNPRL